MNINTPCILNDYISQYHAINKTNSEISLFVGTPKNCSNLKYSNTISLFYHRYAAHKDKYVRGYLIILDTYTFEKVMLNNVSSRCSKFIVKNNYVINESFLIDNDIKYYWLLSNVYDLVIIQPCVYYQIVDFQFNIVESVDLNINNYVFCMCNDCLYKDYFNQHSVIFFCDYCESVFNTDEKLMLHLISLHKMTRNYYCNRCSKIFANFYSLKLHKMFPCYTYQLSIDYSC